MPRSLQWVLRLQFGFVRGWALFRCPSCPPGHLLPTLALGRDPWRPYCAGTLHTCPPPSGRLPACLASGKCTAYVAGRGLAENPLGTIGPSTTLLVPGAAEWGVDVPVEEDLPILVVDYDDAALAYLSAYDPGSPEQVVPFSQAQPSIFPDDTILLARVRVWLQTVAGERAAFYSAAEVPDKGPDQGAPGEVQQEDLPRTG